MENLTPILQIYYGRRGENNLKLSQSCKDALMKFIDLEKSFREKLNNTPELLSEFEKVLEAYDDYRYEVVNFNYSEGFSFGVLLGIDIVDNMIKNTDD